MVDLASAVIDGTPDFFGTEADIASARTVHDSADATAAQRATAGLCLAWWLRQRDTRLALEHADATEASIGALPADRQSQACGRIALVRAEAAFLYHRLGRRAGADRAGARGAATRSHGPRRRRPDARHGARPPGRRPPFGPGRCADPVPTRGPCRPAAPGQHLDRLHRRHRRPPATAGQVGCGSRRRGTDRRCRARHLRRRRPRHRGLAQRRPGRGHRVFPAWLRRRAGQRAVAVRRHAGAEHRHRLQHPQRPPGRARMGRPRAGHRRTHRLGLCHRAGA